MGEGSFTKSQLDPNDGTILLPQHYTCVNSFYIPQFSSLTVERKYLFGSGKVLLRMRNAMLCLTLT